MWEIQESYFPADFAAFMRSHIELAGTTVAHKRREFRDALKTIAGN